MFTDTDSLCYEVKTNDLYSDMLEMKDTYENSCYAKNHFLYDPTNNKTIGKFKDETVNPIIEYVGLRSKLSSCLIETPDSVTEKKTAKGVKSCNIK